MSSEESENVPTLESLRSDIMDVINTLNSSEKEESEEDKKDEAVEQDNINEFVTASLANYHKIITTTIPFISTNLAKQKTQIDTLIKENYNLLYQLQSVRGSFLMYVRVCQSLSPPVTKENPKCIEVYDVNRVSYYDSSSKNTTLFEFPRVYPETSKAEDIFKETEFICSSLFEGEVVLLPNFGEYKTDRTVMLFSQSGLLSQYLNKIYKISKTKKNTGKIEIICEILEIYNEEIFDILSKKKLKLDSKVTENNDNIELEKVTKLEIKSKNDIQSLIGIISTYRLNLSIARNESRFQHSTMYIKIQVICSENSNIKRNGILYLVDLPGSEILNKISTAKDRLSESQTLNKSFMNFIDLLKSLKERRRSLSFQKTKLTLLLKDCIMNQNPRVLFFLTLFNDTKHSSESLSTLNLGKIFQEIYLGPVQNHISMINSNCENSDLKSYIKTLETNRKQLSKKIKELEEKSNDSKNEELLKNIQNLKNEKEEYRIKSIVANKEIDTLKSHMINLENENKKLNNERKNLLQSYQSLTRRCDDSNVEKVQLQNEINKLKSKNNFIKKVSEKESNNNNNNGNTFNCISNTSSESTTPAQSPTISLQQNQQFKEMKISLNQTNHDYIQSEKKNKYLLNQIKRLETNNSLLSEKLLDSNQKILSLNRKCGHLTSQLNVVRQELIEARVNPSKILKPNVRKYTQQFSKSFNNPAYLKKRKNTFSGYSSSYITNNNNNNNYSKTFSLQNLSELTSKLSKLSIRSLSSTPKEELEDYENDKILESSLSLSPILSPLKRKQIVKHIILDENVGCIKIQSVFRGYLDRKSHKNDIQIIKEKMKEYKEERNRNAIKIQKIFRGFSTRKLLFRVLSDSPPNTLNVSVDLDNLFD